MARAIAAVGIVVPLIVLSGFMTVHGLSFTADTVAKLAAATPVKTANLKPSYVAYLPTVRAEAFDVAKSAPVTPAVPIKEPSPLAAPPAPAFTHTVAVDSLRVRSGPHKTTPQVFTLKGGSQVTVVEEDRGWVLIMVGGNRLGWVYGKMLRPADQLQASTR